MFPPYFTVLPDTVAQFSQINLWQAAYINELRKKKTFEGLKTNICFLSNIMQRPIFLLWNLL